MEFMKGILVTACVLSIAITIAGNIKSGEKFSRQLNLIFSLVFTSGIITAAVKTGIDFELPDYSDEFYLQEYSEIESNARLAVKAEIEVRINGIIGDLLDKTNISYEKVSADINIAEDGSIDINRIYYKGDDFERAGLIIEENFTGAEVNRIE